MREYSWWRKQKKRVQKKYTLCCGVYLSPKEVKQWYKDRMMYHKIQKAKNKQ